MNVPSFGDIRLSFDAAASIVFQPEIKVSYCSVEVVSIDMRIIYNDGFPGIIVYI